MSDIARVPAPLARSRRALLGSCAVAAMIVSGGPARSQAVTGTVGFQNGVSIDRSVANVDRVTVFGYGGTNAGRIDWNATAAPNAQGEVPFLDFGKTINFESALTDYVVVNRVLPTAGSGPIRLDGAVNSTVAGGATGGTVWFYSPGGVIAGARSVFNIGSLLLTASNPAPEGGYGTYNRARINGALAEARARVVVESGASITANNAGSYVALLAPRVEQRGTVRVNGSAAYVAASQATLNFNTGSGLFNVAVAVGSEVDPGGEATLIHSGSTTGPSSSGTDADGQAIYMVAVPKNDAISMLVTGTVGYDAAASAEVENGVVVLSGGANITSNRSGGTTTVSRTLPTLTGGGDVQQASTVRIGATTFGSRVDAFGTAAVLASGQAINGLRTDIPSNDPLQRTLDFQGGADLLSYGRTQIDAINRSGTATPAAGEIFRSGGNISLTAAQAPLEFDSAARGRIAAAIGSTAVGTAGLQITDSVALIGGNLTIDAPNVRTIASAADAPSAFVNVFGGGLTVEGGVTITADAGSDPALRRGGYASMRIGSNSALPLASRIGGSVSIRNGLTISANALVGNGSSLAGVGGFAELALVDSGLRVGSGISLSVQGQGGATSAARLSGTGGSIAISSRRSGAALPTGSDVASGISTSAIDANASGYGGSGVTVGTEAAGARGDAFGGTVDATFEFGTISVGSIALSANAFGGAGDQASTNLGQSGGAATGGSVNLLVNGATMDVQSIALNANARGGSASDGEFGYGAGGELGYGAGGSGGGATGGFATFEVRSGSVASSGDSPNIAISARGDGGEGGFAYGSISLPAANAGAGGSAVGGRARILMSGGSLSIGYADLDAGAQSGSGGDATFGLGGAGGTAGRSIADPDRYAAIDVSGGTFTNAGLAIRSDSYSGRGGRGGAGGGAGGAAFGGTARLSAASTTLNATNLFMSADAAGGFGGSGTAISGRAGSTGGIGGNASGGVVRVETGTGGALTINSDFVSQASITAGDGGQGANGTTGGVGGAGGTAIGGTLQIVANGGSISLVENGYGSTLYANAQGGAGGIGGQRLSSAQPGGVGGQGGAGTGGRVDVIANGGSIAFGEGNLTVAADGSGGISGQGGSGSGEGTTLAPRGTEGRGSGGQLLLSATDVGAVQASLTANDVSLSASGQSGFGSLVPPSIAGGITLTANGARTGGAMQLGSLTTLIFADASTASSGTRINAAGGPLSVARDLYIAGAGPAAITGSGAGGVSVGGSAQIYTQTVSIDHLLPPGGSYSTLEAQTVYISTGDFAGTPSSVVRARDAIDIFSSGGLAAGSLYASTSVRAFAGGNLSVVNARADAAIAPGTTTLNAGEGGSPGGNVTLIAGYAPSASRVAGPVSIALDNSNASVTGEVFATNTVSIAAGGDVTIAGTANIASNNLLAIEAGDDLVVSPGAVIRAALDPIPDPSDTGPRGLDGEAGLVLTAGEVGITYDRDPANPSSVVLNGTISAGSGAGARPIFIQGQAVDATGATITGRSLIVDIVGAPAPGAQTQDTDGGLLSALCVRGNLCLGSVDVSDRLDIGGLAGAVPTQVRLSGGFGARSASIVSQGTVTLGATGATTSFTGTDLLRIESQTGGITLLGTANLFGGGASGSGTTSLIAAGPINGAGASVQSALGNIGIRVGSGTLTLGSLIAGGTLNTLNAAGAVVTANALTAPGAITVSSLLSVGSGDARVTAGGPIALGAFTVLNGDAALLANAGAITVTGATQARDVSVRAVAGAVTMGAITARDDIVIRAGGGVATLATLTAGGTVGGQAAIDAAGTADTLAATTLAGNAVDVSGSAGVIVNGRIDASGDTALLATTGNVQVTGATSGRDVAIRALAGGVALGDVTASDDIVIRGGAGTVSFATATTGATVGGFGPVDATGAADTAFGSTLANTVLDVVGSAGLSITGAIVGVGDVSLLASSGSATVVGAIAGRDIAIRAADGQVQTGAITARDDIVIRSTAGATLEALAAGVPVNGQGAVDAVGTADALASAVPASGSTMTDNRISVSNSGAGAVTVAGTVSAAGDVLLVSSGGGTTVTGLIEARDVVVQGTAATVAAINARDDIAVAATGDVITGALTAGATVNGLGATDVSSYGDSALGGTVLGNAIGVSAGGAARIDGAVFTPGGAVSLNAGTGALTVTGAVSASDVLARSQGGAVTLAAVTSRDDIVIRAGTTVSVGSLASGATVGGLGAVDANGPPDSAAGSTLAGNVIDVGATGAATIAGTVASAGDYRVTGASVTLGPVAGPAVTQRAAGAVTVTATAGGITGRNLTLTANGDGVGGEALTLAATGGAIDFAAATLNGGTARESDLQIRTNDAANLLSLGIVNARALLGAIGEAGYTTGVTRSGTIRFGDVTLGTGSFVATSTGGDLVAGSIATALDAVLTASGAIQVAGATLARDVALSGGIIQTGAITAQDDIVIRGRGAITLGALRAGQSESSVGASDTLAGFTLGGSVIDIDGRSTVSLTGAIAPTRIDVRAVGAVSLAGDIDAAELTFSSSDVVIAPTARVGIATNFLSFTNTSTQRTYLGGGDTTEGWSLSNDEFGRLSAANIEIYAPEVGYGAPGVTIGQLDISSPDAVATEARRINLTASDLSIFTDGDIRVDGAMRMTGARAGDRIALTARDRIDVVTPTGSIAILGAGGIPAGSLLMNASEIRVGSQAAIDDLDLLPTTEEKTARFGINDGPVSDAGYIQADLVDLTAESGVFIQNSGVNDPVGARSINPDARRGFTVGAGGLFIRARGTNSDSGSDFGVQALGPNGFATVINGRQRNLDGSFVTGPALIPFVSYDGGEGGVPLDPASTINGCLISDLSCGIVRGAFQGTPTIASGSATIDRQDQLDTITIIGDRVTIDWAPYDSDGTGPIDFLPIDNVGIFQNQPDAGNFVVLNRVLPTTNRPIIFNGTVASRLRTSGPSVEAATSNGGTVWFYSPGGIIAGPTSVFDVGSLLLTANPLTLGDDGGILSTSNLAFGAAGGAITIENGAQLFGVDPAGVVALVGGSIDQAGTVSGSGSVVLASGNGVRINQSGIGYVVSAVSQPSAAVAITTSGLTEAGVDMILAAGNGRIAAGALSAGRDALIGAQSGVSVGAVTAGNDIITGTGAGALGTAALTAGRNVTLIGSGAFTIGAVDAGGSLLIATPASLTLASARAVQDITLSTLGAQSSGALTAGRDVLLVGQSGATATDVAAGRDILTSMAGGPFAAASFTAGGNVTLGGAVAYGLGPVIAGGWFRGSDLASLTATSANAGADIGLATTGVLTLGDLTAGLGVSLSALANSRLGAVVAGQSIATTITGATLTATSLSATGDVILGGTGSYAVGPVIAGPNGSLIADGIGASSIAGARAGLDILLSSAGALTLGNLDAGRDVAVSAQASSIAGTVTAGRDIGTTIASGATLSAASLTATTGNVTLAGTGSYALGPVSAVAGSVRGNGIGAASIGAIDAGVDVSLTSTGALTLTSVAAGQDVTLSARQTSRADTISAGRDISTDFFVTTLNATSLRAGGNVFLDGISAYNIGSVSAGANGSIVGTIAVAMRLGSASAGQDVRLTTQGGLDVGDVTAGRDVQLAGRALGSGGTLSAGRDLTLTFDTGGFGRPSFTATRLTAGGNVTLAGNIPYRLGPIVAGAGGSLIATGIGASSIASVRVGQDILLTSTGPLTLGDLDAGRDIMLSVQGTSIAGVVTAGQNLAATIAFGTLTATSLAATGNVTLAGTGGYAIGSVVTGAIGTLRASGIGSSSIGSVRAGQDILLAAVGTLTLGDLDAGRDISLSALGTSRAGVVTAGQTIATTISGGTLTATSLAATGNVTLDGPGGYAIDSVVAGADGSLIGTGIGASSIGFARVGQNILLASTGALTLGDLSAGRDVALSARGTSRAGVVTAGQNIATTINAGTLTATSLAAVGNVTLAGTGGYAIDSVLAGADGSLIGTGIGASSIGSARVGQNILLTSTGALILGDLSAGRDVTLSARGTSRAGVVTAGQNIATTINAGTLTATSLAATGNVTLGGTGGYAVSSAVAGANGSLRANGVGSSSIGSARAGQDILLASTGTLGLGDLTAGQDVVLTGPGGIVAGAVSAGRDVGATIGATTLTATSLSAVPDIALAGSGSFGVGPVIAGGSFRATNIGAATITSVRAGQDIAISALNRLTLGTLAAGRDIALTIPLTPASAAAGGGAITLTSAVAGGNLAVRSVGVITAGDVRTTGAGVLTLASNSAIRGNSVTGAQDVVIDVQALQGVTGGGGVQIGTIAAGRDLALTSTSGVQLGTASAVRALSARVTAANAQSGSLSAAGLTAGAAVDLAANGAVTLGDVAAGTNVTVSSGTDLAVRGIVTASQGIGLTANRIFVTSAQAQADVTALTDTDAISARLGINDRGLVPDGYLRADRITFTVGNAVYVQNSGGAAFEQRAGFTAGPGGVRIVNSGQGAARVVINGRQRLADGSVVTGLALTPRIAIEGSAGFDPRSTVNGCVLNNPASCIVVPAQDAFPVQDVIQGALGSTDLGFLLPPLIQFADFDPRPSAPLIDEPVTGSANEDLWTPPENGDPECGPGARDGQPCPPPAIQ